MKFAKYVTETGIQRAKGGATPAGKVSHYSEIILPLPTQVIDNSQIGYSTPSLGLLGRGTGEIAGALNDAVTAVAGKDGKDMVGELSNQGSNFVSSLKEKVMNMEADEKAAILKQPLLVNYRTKNTHHSRKTKYMSTTQYEPTHTTSALPTYD